MSAMESSDGLTAQVPGWKHQEEAVNGSVKPSDSSNRSRSRHQGDLTPKLEFGGKTIKMDVSVEAIPIYVEELLLLLTCYVEGTS